MVATEVIQHQLQIAAVGFEVDAGRQLLVLQACVVTNNSAIVKVAGFGSIRESMLFRLLEVYSNVIEPAKWKENLWSSIKDFLQSNGIQHFNYSYSPKNQGGACVKFRSWETEWDSHYKKNEYHKYDEVALYCAKGNVKPVNWNSPILVPFLTDMSARINGEAAEFGIKGGICCPLPSTGSIGGGIFNVLAVGNTNMNDLLSFWTERDIQLFGGLIHLQMTKIVNSEETNFNKSRLTERESQCLNLVAEGKSTKEIADELKCSDRTVNFHVQNAMRKLGAPSRWKAVHLATDFRGDCPTNKHMREL